jgi:hypothetical protein
MSTTMSLITGSPRIGSMLMRGPASWMSTAQASWFVPLMIIASEPHTP